MLLGDGYEIGWGRNSGFQAINLAARFGCTRILLVGLDFSLRHGTHWHGNHPPPLTNPRQATVDEWRFILDSQADALAAAGIEVINCSSTSALTRFKRMPLMEALGV